jgi:formate dehydrogenase alpha subunit
VAGLVTTFGSGAMTNSINEICDAQTILAIGTNTTSAHPVLALQVKDAVRKGAKLIVVNPKEIDLVRYAHLFIRPRPGTDVALLMGMMRVIVDEGLLDSGFIAERCENFEEFEESLAAFDLGFVEGVTGVPRHQIVEAARIYATTKPGSILYTMGITQHSHGTDNVMAVANLAMLTGNVGKPSTGVNPLRGQNNVQGACDMGGLPNVYPGYQRVDTPEIQAKFERAWGYELSDEVGLTHTEIVDAIAQGRIKALYMVGENPVLSEADANHVHAAFSKLDFLVCQDLFLTESAQYADVVLPAASFAEKDGTFTNTERRIQRVRQAIRPVGESKPDWWIVSQIAQRMGATGFDFTSATEIMDEIAAVTPIYGGISYDRLDGNGLQWPCPTIDHPGTVFLHQGRFSRGKGHFVPLSYIPSAELPDDDYPLLLTTDRSLYHYHTSTMTRRVEGLEVLDGREQLKVNPQDANRLQIADGERVKITSRRGETEVEVEVTDICPPGVVSLTFHFWEVPTNVLTNRALDPVAKIPETKVAAVRVAKIDA